MSSAESDTPRSADSLPPLAAAQAMIREAAPDPPPGPIREQLAEQAAQRVDRAVSLMDVALRRYVDRLAGVVEARMRSPRTRRGTRWWEPATKGYVTKVAFTGGQCNLNGVSVETKALDGSYIVPERVISDELADAIRPVGLRIVSDAAASVARGLGRPNVGLAAFDHAVIERAVDSIVGRMLEVNERHVRDVRAEILGADATAESLDEAIDRVMEATKRGGRWLMINGRTLATALAGDAALAAAKALGVTHTQWLSRRDGRVRETHVLADGQVRAVGEKFDVGGFALRFPADPFVLPAGASVVLNCRCGLIFMPPDAQRSKAVALAEGGTPVPARTFLGGASVRRGAIAAQMVEGAPELGSAVTVPQRSVPQEVVGYRVLDTPIPVTPGQRVSWPGPLALGLAPATGAALTLAVVLPAGYVAGVAAGAAVLPAAAELEILSVSADQVVARPIAVVV